MASRHMLPPAGQVTATYDLKTLHAPTLVGNSLNLFIGLTRTPAFGLVYPSLSRNSGFPQVLSDIDIPENPTFTPCAFDYEAEEQVIPFDSSTLENRIAAVKEWLAVENDRGSLDRLPSITDYVAAYSSGVVTPGDVADRIIRFLQEAESRKTRLGWVTSWDEEFIDKQAKESTTRLQGGKARSFLEGVPFAVKEDHDAVPYPSTCGTAFIASRRPTVSDHPLVAALKSMGAVLIGKTTMQEIGLGVIGLNTVTGTARNPHNLEHYCGASSSGSAAVVAAGLVPFAIGSDGGGSVRIPASFCGCVGLMPTIARTQTRGGYVPICNTVVTSGFLTRCVQDAALLYAIIANLDSTVPGHHLLPAPVMPRPVPAGAVKPLAGMRIGIYKQWFENCDSDVQLACEMAARLLQAAGAVRVDIQIPELEALRVAHTTTLTSEIYNNQGAGILANPAIRSQCNGDTLVSLACAARMTASEYLQAQKVRTRAGIHFQNAFKLCDVIITPSTPIAAPAINPASLKGGESNLTLSGIIMRYVPAANMLGLPAISIPVGKTSEKLPIGLQVLGRCWQDATVLRVAAALEAALPPLDKPAAVWLNPCTGQRPPSQDFSTNY